MHPLPVSTYRPIPLIISANISESHLNIARKFWFRPVYCPKGPAMRELADHHLEKAIGWASR